MTTVSCPSCQSGFTPPVVECPACGLPLTGPLAGALWQTDQQIAALQIRRAELIHGLRHPEAAGAAAPVTLAAEPARRRDSWHGQQVLLAAGALLVLTAAVVFLAVAWSRIGVGVQVGVMGMATVVAGYTSLRMARHGLRATAEALGVLTAGLAVVDVSAAYALNLAGLEAVDESVYGSVAAAVLAVAFTVVWSRRLSLVAYPLAAVAAAAAAAALALGGVDAETTHAAVVGLLAAALFTALRLLLPPGWSAARIPLLVVAGAYLLLCWGSALFLVFTEDLLGRGGLGALIALAAATGVGWRAELHRSLHLAQDHPVGAGCALVAAAATLTGLAWHAEDTGLLSCVLVTLAGVVAGGLAWRLWSLSTSRLGVLAVGSQLLGLLGLLAVQVADQADFDHHTAEWVALTVAVAVTATSAVLTAVRRPRVGGLFAGYAGGLVIFLSYAAARPSGLTAVSVAITLAAVAITAGAAWCRGLSEERVLAPIAVLAGLIAIQSAQEQRSPQLLALVLAIIGLTAFAYGVLPGRGLVALIGVASCTAATWTLLLYRDVTAIEAYSLPLAALIAGVGLVRLRRDPASPSWLTVGPALSAALLPSAVVSLDDEGLTRPLLVLLAGVVVLVGGVMIRWQSPVLVGSVAILVVACAQLAPYAVGLPRWLSFGTLGLVLLVLGARYEQRRRNAQHAVRWVGALR